ncbi:MAG: sulfatase modifying factor 1 [Sphingobacteriales bacterium]|jgi:sulfatase modifying factor 1
MTVTNFSIMNRNKISLFSALCGVLLLAVGCNKSQSSTTGWSYNDKKNGGFEVYEDIEQATGPGLVLIEGGTFVMGSVEQDVTYDNANMERRVTVASFYIDETEVKNVDYLEYLYWLSRVFGQDYPEVVRKALPDTLVWRSPLAYNEPYVTYYLRHPSYQEYPVVGVSWAQANEYAAWRTDRVNEQILVDKGILKHNPNQQNEDNFNTEAYLNSQYEGLVKKNLKDISPNGDGRRSVRMQDGILLPDYRLPTEAEWEYAALSLRGNTVYNNVNQKKIYPWNGIIPRASDEDIQGLMLANFKRGRGDNMGVAGFLNDGYDLTAPVNAYLPNDYGVYNMAGNVSEWVLDVYRPLSYEDMNDFNPYRGNVYEKNVNDADGNISEKDSLGRIKKELDNENYVDPDKRNEDDDVSQYDYGNTSLVNNKARVFKGGSWNDRAYWMTPGSRRFIDENMSTAEIGFRCAMVRVGGPLETKKDKKFFFKN